MSKRVIKVIEELPGKGHPFIEVGDELTESESGATWVHQKDAGKWVTRKFVEDNPELFEHISK